MLGVSLLHHSYVQPKTDAAHKTVETNIFVTWISLLYEELKLINMFPSRALVTETTPLSFKCFLNLRIILDCTEIYNQRSADVISQNLLYSNYKKSHHF